MSDTKVRVWFPVIATIGIVSVSAGWVYGACHTYCDEVTCSSLPAPMEEFNCERSSVQCCDDGNAMWTRGLAFGTCTQHIGIMDVDACEGCDTDCPNNPSVADPCQDCEFYHRFFVYFTCDLE